MAARRIAVVLFNLGGPDRPEAVRPFLFNLFSDPAIIALPSLPRRLIAWLVARRRAPLAREIYAQLGGGSPLLANTEAQARALEQALAGLGTVRAFPCMRYWHPLSADVAAAVRGFAPDATVLLPLYPQFSSTTTGSSLAAWRRAARAAGLAEPGRAICCYPVEPGFIEAIADGVAAARAALPAEGPEARILFTAHGLPKRVVERGDPYVAQVEATVAAVARRLALPDDAWRLCFQSRVGPLEWVGPYTDAEIKAAGAEGRPVVMVPVAFVSEHSETLVELDIEYRRLAEECGVPAYLRVPTVGIAPAFVAGLARLVRQALQQPGETGSGEGGRRCTADRACCPLAAPAIEEAA
ncbi:MAG: ferrochelatase [Dongiaceae bacterium]